MSKVYVSIFFYNKQLLPEDEKINKVAKKFMLSHRIQSRHYYSSNLLFVHWPRNTPPKKWNPFKLETAMQKAASVSVKVRKVRPRTAENVSAEGWKSRRGCVSGNSVIFLPTFKPYTCSESLSSDTELFKFTPFYHSATPHRQPTTSTKRESRTHIGDGKRNVNELFPSLFRSCHCSENWGREMCLREFKNENAGKCCRKMAWDGRILILSGYFYESAKHNTHPNREWSSSPRCRRHL